MSKSGTNWKIAAAIFLIILILRAPAFWTPILDTDESFFAGYANVLLSGGVPFVDCLDTKPYGIYYFFALIFSLFGKNNMVAVHAATAVVVGLTALYCHRIARLFYSERAGIFAALFYAIFTTTYIPKFISTSIVVVMMLPVTMSIYYLLSCEKYTRYWRLWLAGFLLGVACLFKYQAGITLVAVAFYYLVFSPLYAREISIRKKICDFLVYFAGTFVVGILFVIHLVSIGVWDQFWFWSVEGSRAYIETGNLLAQFPVKLLVRGGSFVASTLLIWFFGIRHLAGLIRNIFTPLGRTKRQCGEYLIPIWFLFNIIPVSTGGRFYGHYFIQLLPPLVVMASVETDHFFTWLTNSAVTRLRQLAYALFVIGLIVPALGFFGARLVDDQIYKAIGEENPNNYKPIAAYIEKHTKPEDKIFVWGFATPIYIFSNRDAASRFLVCDWLTGRVTGSPTARDRSFDTSQFITRGSWELLLGDLEKNKPVYFVDTSPGNYHDYGKYPVQNYPQLMNYLSEHYGIEESIAGADIYRRTN